MSNESTEPTLTDERLRELRDILHNGWERDGDTEDEMRDAIDELLRLRLRPAEREGGPFDPVWIGMLHTAASEASPVYRGVILRAAAALASPAKEPNTPQPCPRCQKLVTTSKDGRLHQHTRVKYGIRVTCEETIDGE